MLFRFYRKTRIELLVLFDESADLSYVGRRGSQPSNGTSCVHPEGLRPGFDTSRVIPIWKVFRFAKLKESMRVDFYILIC